MFCNLFASFAVFDAFECTVRTAVHTAHSRKWPTAIQNWNQSDKNKRPLIDDILLCSKAAVDACVVDSHSPMAGAAAAPTVLRTLLLQIHQKNHWQSTFLLTIPTRQWIPSLATMAIFCGRHSAQQWICSGRCDILVKWFYLEMR